MYIVGIMKISDTETTLIFFFSFTWTVRPNNTKNLCSEQYANLLT